MVAAIAILAGIVIVAINPGKQLAETRNAQRNTSVNTVINAIYQYAIDNNGTIPSSINDVGAGTCADAANEICASGGTCTGITDLGVLTANGTYLVAIPQDPSGGTANGAGYHVTKLTSGRIEVCAPDAEEGATISVMK